MRAWDNHNSYLDNDGKILHGKIRFCKKATTDNVAIYNRDGVALRNPAFTDMLGRTEYQVFLNSDADVTAYYYKYIGTGDMMTWQGEDYDPSRWAYQYSSDSMDPSKIVDLTATTADGVATMTDLRAKDPETVPTVNGAKLLWLYGYYTAGDKSPVLYYWDSASLKNDDGGAVIMHNNTSGPGRWILASNDLHFDVRHFGVFPQSDKYSVDYSYTSQLANCGIYIDNCGLDAWFPDNNGAMSYYLLNGANTFSINGNIYCSDSVRFVCKTGTTGTAIACNELHKRTPYLFDSSVQTGTATLTADWINISWVGGNCTGNARVGWVIDTDDFVRNISGKEVHFEHNGSPSLSLDNCLITSNKNITGQVNIQNSVLKTDFFADDYDWSKLTSVGNTILLSNCKDANTYIKLKNKQGESNYGDLGEQQINADVLAGGNLENCFGSAKFISHGSTEMHNVSLTLTGLTSTDSINAVDSWLTLTANSTVASIQLRRGALLGSGVSLQVLGASLFNDANIEVALNAMGTSLTLEKCDVRGSVTGQTIVMNGNDIYAQVDQSDVSGAIAVYCVGNMFHSGARHYVHANTAGSLVSGVWMNNGSDYDNVHWIRLDRTNLNDDDLAHSYKYYGNAEPFLDKWSGRAHPMTFKCFGGHWTTSSVGTDVFAEYNSPFMFYNDRERSISVVNKTIHWKMFTVGRLHMCRSGRIAAAPRTIGVLEGDYSYNGQVVPTWTWGCADTEVNDSVFSCMECVSFDGTGEANYDVSFEASDTVHGEFSYGPYLGWYPSNDFREGSWQNKWAVYPATTSGNITICVMLDKDFETVTNPS